MSAELRFIERMYRERRKQGLSQAALAKAASAEGVSIHPTAITKLEWGLGNDPRPQRKLTLNEAVAIASALELTALEMYADVSTTLPEFSSLYALLDDLDHGNLPGSKIRWQGREIWLHTTPQVEGWIRTFIEGGAK